MNYDLNFLTAQTCSTFAFQVGYLYMYVFMCVCLLTQGCCNTLGQITQFQGLVPCSEACSQNVVSTINGIFFSLSLLLFYQKALSYGSEILHPHLISPHYASFKNIIAPSKRSTDCLQIFTSSFTEPLQTFIPVV